MPLRVVSVVPLVGLVVGRQSSWLLAPTRLAFGANLPVYIDTTPPIPLTSLTTPSLSKAMPEGSSSSYDRRLIRHVFCPNYRVFVNRFTAMTGKNNKLVFHKCLYLLVCLSLHWSCSCSSNPRLIIWCCLVLIIWCSGGGCQFYQWEDEIDVTPSQTGHAATLPIQPMALVAMQAVASTPTSASAPVANINEAS